MEVEEIRNLIKNIPVNLDSEVSEYNPLEIFVDRVREKEICHSKIIAELLDPKGRHKLGNVFLSSFLKYIEINDKDFCDENIEVQTEHSVQSSLPNMTKRRIDICIYNDENKKAIIIENKINNAGEQEQQISDYKNGLEEDGYNVLKTVCLLSPLGNRIKDADCYIAPSELASIFETQIPHTSYGIKSYITLLKNMDKKTEQSKIAKDLLDNMPDDDFKKLREIAISFYENIAEQAFQKIVEALKEKNVEHRYSIKHNNCLQLWNDDAYKNGTNKGFWIEVWFYDFNRFEIWITKDQEEQKLDLQSYVPSKKYPMYYVDKDVDSIKNGTEAKKFDFPDKKQFEEMITYLEELYKKLYKIS